MNLAADILRLLDTDPPVAEVQWAEQALTECPYFVLPLLLTLRCTDDADVRGRLLPRLAAAWPDRRSLALQLGEGVDALERFYPPLPLQQAPDTVATIDRFLQQYGSTNEREVAALTQAIFNPTPDYADVLAAQASKQDNSGNTTEQDDLINTFIAEAMERERQAGPPQQQAGPDREQLARTAGDTIDKPEETDAGTLSESLAQMYIGQGKFRKALDIIERLNFSFPEKSAYFADQIRFLRGVVMIQQFENK